MRHRANGAARQARNPNAMNDRTGWTPRRVSDPAEAFALVRAEGAAVLTDSGSSRDDARGIAARVLASLEPVIPDPAPIQEGGGNADRAYPAMPGIDGFTVPFQSGHTDGFAYGDAYPDYIFLLCVRPARSGGASFVVDTYALLDALRDSADPDDRAFHTFLTTVPIEQTEPDFQASVAPVILDNGRGRRMSRWTPVQRPDPRLPADEIARHAALLERWKAIAFAASTSAATFSLQAGETLCIDNYRMLHGRTGFDDIERSLWRIWAWTTEARRVPQGMLFSDSRFAVTR
jgi:alpha-ketoglutarate-dependent taurine dioxygenase